jgi:hypothetical protein
MKCSSPIVRDGPGPDSARMLTSRLANGTREVKAMPVASPERRRTSRRSSSCAGG